MHEVPQSFAENNGSLYDFTWDSAFWVFNWVSNFAYLRYSDMIEDIRTVQQELEGRFLSDQPAVEQAAEVLFAQSPRLAIDYLTDYSVKAGDGVTQRWRRLGEFLLVKYLDGNVKTPTREVTHPGYPENWYHLVVGASGDKLGPLTETEGHRQQPEHRGRGGHEDRSEADAPGSTEGFELGHPRSSQLVRVVHEHDGVVDHDAREEHEPDE